MGYARTYRRWIQETEKGQFEIGDKVKVSRAYRSVCWRGVLAEVIDRYTKVGEPITTYCHRKHYDTFYVIESLDRALPVRKVSLEGRWLQKAK